MEKQGRRDPTFQVNSIHVIMYRGSIVEYAWGSGEAGNSYGVIFDGDWLVFDELEYAVKFFLREKGR